MFVRNYERYSFSSIQTMVCPVVYTDSIFEMSLLLSKLFNYTQYAHCGLAPSLLHITKQYRQQIDDRQYLHSSFFSICTDSSTSLFFIVFKAWHWTWDYTMQYSFYLLEWKYDAWNAILLLVISINPRRHLKVGARAEKICMDSWYSCFFF